MLTAVDAPGRHKGEQATNPNEERSMARPRRDHRLESIRRSSPQTDPTNPSRQESTGRLLASERESERRQDEPGLTDLDRQERGPFSNGD